MKKILFIALSSILFAKSYTQQYYTWIQKSDFGGEARWGAVSFAIGNKGYLGTGLPPTWVSNDGTDFWQYDPSTNTWTQVATFPGPKRREATAFVIGSKGYVATGADDGTVLNDLWEYDATRNSWTRKADFPGSARWYAISFAVNGKGYIGTGSDGSSTAFKDFWEYDPGTDTWARKADVPGNARIGACAFSIGNKGYLGGGSLGGGSGNDFWEYDPANDTWARKADIGGSGKYDVVSFTISNKGYTGAGGDKEFWEYDPAIDKWSRQPDFAGVERSKATAFAIGDIGYIGTGLAPFYSKDIWAFTPCNPVGDPTIFGDNIWNVYGWNSGGATINNNAWNINYAGYYAESSVSFNTQDRWSSTASPSNASGYQGCIINADNHSWSAKRKGFPCGVYSINVLAHDDAAQLFVNGAKVWEHNGCCDIHNNVWKGVLGADSKIEFRTTEGVGGSRGQIQFVAATPTITAMGLTDLCIGSTVTLSSDIGTGNQWYKGGVAISGANQQTYSASETGTYSTIVDVPGCSAVRSGNSISVTVATQAPGDPTLFANTSWNVSVYNSGNGTLAGTTWQNGYSGYYTSNSFSFNTANDWSTTAAPSGAADYHGCLVNPENHSWSAKRQGFPCNRYQINVTGHDDAAQLLIDGVEVWEHDGCCDAHNDVWEGYLDANSKVEFRGTESTGSSYGAIDILASKPIITASGNTNFCPGQSVTLTASPGNDYLWSTGETTQSITISQTGSYTVTETNNCGNQVQSDPVTVTVQPLAPPTIVSFDNFTILPCYGSEYLEESGYDPWSGEYTFAWYKADDPNPISTDYFVNVTDAGDYYLVVSRAGCSSDPSAIAHVTTITDPSVFGDNQWNVYLWQDYNYNENNPDYHYQGYYTEPLLSFDTRNRWDPSGAPFYADNYLGCSYDYDHFLFSAKRKGFPCGHYKINIPVHNDWAELWVNGAKVWEHIGCCDSHTAVWEGDLGPNSTVEFKVTEIGGDAYGAIDFELVNADMVTKPTITPSGPLNICSVDNVTLASSAVTGNTWSTGETTQSITVNTAGSYSVTVTSSEGCTAQSDPVQVSVTQAQTYYRDADSDGYGNPNVSKQACVKPVGYVSNNTDCDDTRASVRPGAPEICDGLDNNCNGTIDEGCITLSIADVSMKEGNKGKSNMMFAVTLSKAFTKKVTVQFATQNGTAIAGSDYDAKSGSLTFNAGTTKQTINISISGDKTVEANETFKVNLSNAVNATIAKASGTGTILNDDGATAIAVTSLQTSNKTGERSVKISPNPASSLLRVDLSGYTGNVTMQLVNLQGKVLRQEKMQTGVLQHAQQQINVTDIVSGTYFLVITDEKGNRQTEKVIVAR